MTKFVEDWDIVQTLGDGAYAEVKLLVHQTSGDCIAVKIVDLEKHEDAKTCTEKETKIHKFLSHRNVIRMLGKRAEESIIYIFLEYAVGGELFNRIEPDIGMPCADVQKYMRQILAGLDYLFTVGVAHRDLKPENLLLDEHDVIKISDFGMATIYRFKGRERLLDKKCGTLPYVAPEVLKQPYHAEPADIWSCGVIFVAMLSGELPWDEPTNKCIEFEKWSQDSCILRSPWSKLDNTAISLVRKILNIVPKKRVKIQDILNHPWMQQDFDAIDDVDAINQKRPGIGLRPAIPIVVLSQPMCNTSLAHIDDVLYRGKLHNSKMEQCVFSQPAHYDDLLISSQVPLTQGSVDQNKFDKMIRRMTRFTVTTDLETTVQLLSKSLESLGLTLTPDQLGGYIVTTTDSRKSPLAFKVNLWCIDGKVLTDFRLHRGCGLEFKKRFLKVKRLMSEVIVKLVKQRIIEVS